MLKCHKCSEESVPRVLWEQKGFGEQGKIGQERLQGKVMPALFEKVAK